MLGNRFAREFRKWIHSNPYRKWIFYAFIALILLVALLKNIGIIKY